MATLKFINVNKIYDNNVQAVFDFNLEIKDKEFIVFVGPSGCGKSTTLRMVAGLEDISTGELYIDGKLVNYVAPMDRHIAMVFQSYALYPHMTVYQNMTFGLKIRKAYRPVYAYDEETNSLLKESATLRRSYKKISEQLSKSPDNLELQGKEKEAREKLIGIYDQIIASRKPLVGIDNAAIKRNEKAIKKLESGIIRISKHIDKEKGKNEEERNDLLIDTMQRDVEYKKNQVNELQNENEHLRNNEVEIKKLRNIPPFERDSQVLRAAIVLDLIKYLARKPSELSGGQKQRVALGRAIVRNPRVFLMDEPLSNLDAKLRVQTRSEIAKIHKKVGTTTIYVTHDQTEAMTLADRIVIMKDGRIQQIATPKEAYNEPANMFVGGFIGSPAMNFIKGTYSKGAFTIDGETNQSIKLNLEFTKALSAYEGKNVALGIRPENIKRGDSKFALSVDLDDIELLGNEFIYYLRLNGQSLLMKVDADHEITEKEGIIVSFDMQKAHFFDLETTLKIK